MCNRPSLHLSASLAGTLLLLAGAGLPANAQTASATKGASSSPDAASAQRSARRTGTRMICIRGEVTESRIPRQVCRTEAEWRATGEVPGEETGRR